MKFKLYLIDENENSPCFGIDEEIELNPVTAVELDTMKSEAKQDYEHFLFANEGFSPCEIGICRDGIEYQAKIKELYDITAAIRWAGAEQREK